MSTLAGRFAPRDPFNTAGRAAKWGEWESGFGSEETAGLWRADLPPWSLN